VDEARLREFLAGAYPAVLARLEFGLRPPVAVEDLVQEAVVRAWARETAGEPIDSLSAWVSTVAANLGRDRLRSAAAEERAWRRRGPDLPPQDPSFVSERVVDAIAELSPRLRDVVFLHYFGDLDVATVAVRLGLAQGTVKAALHRARTALATRLTDLRPERPGRSQVIGCTGYETTSEGTTMAGWQLAGSHPREYEIGRRAETGRSERVAFLRATAAVPAGFGTVMQTIAADDYRGRRVRLRAELAAAGVAGWAGLWLRVDGPAGRINAFDNCQDRPVAVDAGFGVYEVVLDVAVDSERLAFGVLLSGSGSVDIACVSLDRVSDTVAVTAPVLPKTPVNLDFTEPIGTEPAG
jgi:RNA polymerase sigma factor (sigma-70 family)